MSGTNLSATTPTGLRLAGVVEASIDGVSYNCTAYSWSPSRFTRQAMASMSGIDGYSETPIAAFIELTLRDARNVSISDFNAKTGATVVINIANGKQVVGHNMVCMVAQEVSGADATFVTRWEIGEVYEAGIAA